MLTKALLISPVLMLAACSSHFSGHYDTARPQVHYARDNSKMVKVNAVSATGNQCVDNFNFLRQAGDERYQDFSRQYITVGNGYTFLNRNKNIMDNDARRIYTMKLDMKLDTLCSRVNYAGYQVIQQKIKELHGI